ncbi:Pre protein translocase subunit Sec66-domain-containing protein [Exophiala viscosa]|uniref:Pre protein translocase subunit Sec66-domain-containing protein n=1 Tax=Exophiala viscosa TaxID=2486360 RepID=A0AAN6E5X0_9EURO|nr:Pre protein translocase subunit Sec66-domain-containing protein [Exophiala viscosa]KAI1627704.1 Pre protein translocase subunit Sec66-domain-containing protein [Exophiala viscosa]
MQYLSLLGPIAYLGILIGSMATFSHLYRQRQVNSKLRLAPYFGPHTTRNIYLSLLHLQDDQKVPESVLRAALLARANEDIQRIMEVRTRKPALAQLLQRGVVGDEIFQRLQRAEQELEIELKDVVAEANALAPNWGSSIFQSASEMVPNKLLREKLEVIKTRLPAEKEAWNAQREKSRRELEGDGDVLGQPSSVVVEPAATPQKMIPVKAASSDEDGVIVETPATEPTTPGGGGKSKKKKGKK